MKTAITSRITKLNKTVFVMIFVNKAMLACAGEGTSDNADT